LERVVGFVFFGANCTVGEKRLRASVVERGESPWELGKKPQSREEKKKKNTKSGCKHLSRGCKDEGGGKRKGARELYKSM